MLAFNYGSFIIRDSYWDKSFKVYLKDNKTLYSQMSFTTPAIAAKKMKKIEDAELVQMYNECKCGCGENIYDIQTFHQKYKKGHNAKLKQA